MHPISYIVIPWKNTNNKTKTGRTTISKNKIVEDYTIVDTCKNFDCFDLCRTSREFQKKIFGIKTAFHDNINKKTIIVSGIVDDILIECINDTFIYKKKEEILKLKPKDPDFQGEEFETFLDILTIKELLIYSNEELYQRFIGYINQTNLIKLKPISQNVKEFIGGTLFEQRKTLIQLLIKKNDPEFQYLAYLLYDLLSNDSNNTIDTVEQTVLFDSLPWNIKKLFREAMKTTINYTKTLSNYDYNKIPLEQQICLMKASDTVKEKAMTKLKEVKAKAEDSGSKARQYLDGLLKIPFGIYKNEPILSLIDDIKINFEKVLVLIKNENLNNAIPVSDIIEEGTTCVEIVKYLNCIKNNVINQLANKNYNKLLDLYTNVKRDILITNICFINKIIKDNEMKYNRLCHSGKKSDFMKKAIKDFIVHCKNNTDIIKLLSKKFKNIFSNTPIETIKNLVLSIEENLEDIQQNLKNIKNKLDISVHGHENAKRQLERIIGQWINGENTGYCLGFEGPPGVGKTSLAKKGLVNCLLDHEGNGRPFSLIQIGGGSNGSTLAGHGFTYVGSQWGRIVDILIETKCMNPIILIDEVDKLSQSENGKEITGILTHLVDDTQNDSFQDKFFSGIDIDLSKALFIFSYNDPERVDKILLNRIHRIKFDNLSLEDKLVILKDYIIPEIYNKFSISECVIFSDEILEYIIETYTYEPGVRKLKEIIYEIIGEVNLELLHNTITELPVVITKELLTNKYLKDKIEVTFTKIHKLPSVGLINGLWANSLGKGGIIQIETQFYPSQQALSLKLTGSLGDVMKESSDVAKDVAWSLIDESIQNKFLDVSKNLQKGIRIHFPEGATPKNGPSAGTAITVAIYSLLNNKKIKNNLAITGEINLQGNVTAIGGLDLKILGGIAAGVKEFIFPLENKKDFDKFMKKYKDNEAIKNIIFHNVSHINDVLKLVFV
jgi:ATP-dependent Lon protease